MATSVLLKDGERIDDLEIRGFRIIQNPFYFCFGIDSVLLSGFADISPGERVLDLGTGNGIIPLLLAAKEKGSDWTGLELQPEIAEMAERSVKLNHVEDCCHICTGDMKRVGELFPRGSFDAVTSNPPYMKAGSGLVNPDSCRTIARHEVRATLEDVAGAAAYLLKPRGTFTMVHRPRRLADIFETLLRFTLEPKRLQLVQPYRDREPNMVLIEAVKQAGRELRVLPTLTVYEEDGSYTQDILRIYGKL